jgi:hypothetical protein
MLLIMWVGSCQFCIRGNSVRKLPEIFVELKLSWHNYQFAKSNSSETLNEFDDTLSLMHMFFPQEHSCHQLYVV